MSYYEALTTAYEAAPGPVTSAIVLTIILISVGVTLVNRLLSIIFSGQNWIIRRTINSFMESKDEKIKPIADALKCLPEQVEAFKTMRELMHNMSYTNLLQTYHILMAQDKMISNMYQGWMDSFLLYEKQGWNGGLYACRDDLRQKRNNEIAGG